MTKKVFFADLNDFFGISRLHIFQELLKTSQIKNFIKKDEIVAIKMHFGEKGNLAYVHPQYIRQLVDYVKQLGGKPFLTDTNTLNGTWRLNGIDHIATARNNGFTEEITGAPIIIADGIKGNSCKWCENEQKNIKNFALGIELINADKIIYVSHFKGHQIGGFGGTLKNLGVGSASKVGKMDIHYKFEPEIDKLKCDKCNQCLKVCSNNAIESDKNGFNINRFKCVQCCECISVCSNEAISLYENCDWRQVQERYVEYGAAMMKVKKNAVFFINILENITQACGCWGFSDSYMIADIGFAASEDPVALDYACYNLVNESPFISSPDLKECEIGKDKFSYIYPHVNAKYQLEYAENIALGDCKYELERLTSKKTSKKKILEAR